jgi:hypothetical protein
LRRIVIAVTALVVLGTASAVYAATSNPINTYTAPMKFTPGKAGSKKKPSPTGFTQDITAMGTNGNRTAVTLDFLTKIYGLKVDGKDFPTCSLKKIATDKSDSGCPKGAKVASGFITAALGSYKNFAATAPGVQACDPKLDVWNGGQGKLTFFFVTDSTHVCLGGALTTGGTPPYPATYKNQGGFLVTNVPIPAAINFPLGPGVLAGSLESEHLVWAKRTKKVKGKTVASVASVACKGGKRPYSTKITANLPSTHETQTTTVSGSAKCSK